MASKEIAEPLHLQRLKKSLDVTNFLNCVEQVINAPISDWECSSDSELEVLSDIDGHRSSYGFSATREEMRSDRIRLYNFENVRSNRRWLRDLLVSDTSSSSDDEEPFNDDKLQHMLKMHLLEKKHRLKFHENSVNHQYQYFGSGLVSNYDRFPEHQKYILGTKRKKKDKKSEVKLKKMKKPTKERTVTYEKKEQFLSDDFEYDDVYFNLKDEDTENFLEITPFKGMRGKKKIHKNPELMTARRKKVFAMLSKRELGKIQRAKVNNHKETLATCKRLAHGCMKVSRQRAMQSQKNMKETIWRAKRLTREMQAYWKRYDRVEREARRRLEREAEEQRRLDGELMEAKRQQRKLNFLITQTELYAHFMSRKLGGVNHKEQLRILSQLEEEKIPRLATIDDYDSDAMKLKAKKNVRDAVVAERNRTSQFYCSNTNDFAEDFKLTETGIRATDERPQPSIFKGNLKHYQLKGMNWLANLYDQGINGILADEMGLGKTVQSIAFLCHIAEKYNVWGPFLIISPASTLHNWQQEMARFVPAFKVVPYWGSPQERKILRQFWDQKDLHTKGASFHVVITSYQLVITDFKYFNRIKWQYLVLDEAQALKSTNSVRWKLLLGFSCRNRLLLSGTPIQNSMAELWALLHFIMPTLFDSHDEFNEWFSKDIESHAENKTGIDEKHLSRLHMILKPFMLRRIKKDVENELSDKIEVMVYCPLTTRQKLLYKALKKKIRIEDLLHSSSGSSQSSQTVTSSLMNLVMQFRKVCNHPELFERREAKSPVFFKPNFYEIPRLVFDDGILLQSIPSKNHLLENMFCIFTEENMHRSLYPKGNGNIYHISTPFSFIRFCNISPNEVNKLTLGGLLRRFIDITSVHKREEIIYCRNLAGILVGTTYFLCLMQRLPISCYGIKWSNVLSRLVFTSVSSTENMVYCHTRHIHCSTSETLQHRIHRSRKVFLSQQHSNNLLIFPSSLSKSPIFPKQFKKCEIDIDNIGNEQDLYATEQWIQDDENEVQWSLPNPDSPGSPKEMTLSTSFNEPKSPLMVQDEDSTSDFPILPEFLHQPKLPRVLDCEPTHIPSFLFYNCPKVHSSARPLYCSSRRAASCWQNHVVCSSLEGLQTVWYGSPEMAKEFLSQPKPYCPESVGGVEGATPYHGWSKIVIPDKQTLVTDAGKLYVLDGLLKRLKEQGHRVLIYSQMTRMIDLLEEYMWHRKHTFMRLDGSSKISERRDMVADFQSRQDIFVFLLSTRAGGLGINLTAADTVIFYDSDWNPTVDQQAMDRAHRLGQTKQVTVYRLICKGTIEERILQRAREKSEIQRMVISGGNFKPDTLKPKEVVSLLLDDEEIENKYRQRQAERRSREEIHAEIIRDRDRERKRKQFNTYKDESADDFRPEYCMPSPAAHEVTVETIFNTADTENELVIEDRMSEELQPFASNVLVTGRPRPGRGGRRGRPRGSRRVATSLGRPSGRAITVSTTAADLGISVPSLLDAPPPVARRGPGRPRLRPLGPAHSGGRGGRTRRAPGPLPVPLHFDVNSTPPPSPFGLYSQTE